MICEYVVGAMASSRLLSVAIALSILVAQSAAIAQEVSRPVIQFDAAVEMATSLPRLHSLLVSRDGELILEKYLNGRTASSIANVKSVSKSVISALVGIAIGIGAASALTRRLQALLFETSPLDPVAFVAVATLSAAVSLLASWLPARRAARVEPAIALRAE